MILDPHIKDTQRLQNVCGVYRHPIIVLFNHQLMFLFIHKGIDVHRNLSREMGNGLAPCFFFSQNVKMQGRSANSQMSSCILKQMWCWKKRQF